MTQEVQEGLGELADVAERDHEVQMARAELYKLAKYAIKLHDMLKGVSEAEGLEGWVQSKITKSADMIGSVYHHMDYDQSPMGEEPVAEGKYKNDAQRKAVHASKNKKKKKDSYKESLQDRLTSKLTEAESICDDCGKTMLTASEKKELADLAEGERHGNSKIYKKCWKGCRKVAGKKRGEPGSCKCD